MTTQRLTMRAGIILAAVFSICAITPPLWAAMYYVDATGGNDSNTGASEATPWKTIARVNSRSFSPGDSILLKRGEIWRETLIAPSSGSAGNVIVFGAYGAGDNPIISGSNLISAGWTRDSAFIWKATVTTQPNAVYFNGTRGTLATAKTSITAEYLWFWASNVLYVWSPDDGDPSGHYTAPGIEAAARDNPVNTNNNAYISLDGLTIRDGNLPYGASHGVVKVGYTTVTGIIIQNCTVERGSANGIDIHGTAATDITINNNTIRDNGGFGIWVNNTFIAGIIRNNIITRNGWGSAAYAQQFSGIQGYLGNLEITGNRVHDNVLGTAENPVRSHGIYVLASTAVTNIHDNVIYNQPNGSGIKLIGSGNVYRNIIYGNAVSGINPGQNGATNVVYSIYYNLIYGNNASNTGDGIYGRRAIIS